MILFTDFGAHTGAVLNAQGPCTRAAAPLSRRIPRSAEHGRGAPRACLRAFARRPTRRRPPRPRTAVVLAHPRRLCALTQRTITSQTSRAHSEVKCMDAVYYGILCCDLHWICLLMVSVAGGGCDAAGTAVADGLSRCCRFPFVHIARIPRQRRHRAAADPARARPSSCTTVCYHALRTDTIIYNTNQTLNAIAHGVHCAVNVQLIVIARPTEPPGS